VTTALIVILFICLALILVCIAGAWYEALRGPDHYVNGVKHKGLTWECAKCKRGEA
jgi:hypothetical protein